LIAGKTLFITLGSLELLVGLGALWGGGALFLVPDGSFLHMDVSILNGTPFGDYRIPGLILFAAVGGINTWAGLLALRRRPSAVTVGLIAGAIQIGWIVSELALLGYIHWAQALYLGFGLATLALALAARRV
jgi:hypothetical protein